MRGQPGHGALYIDSDGTQHKAVLLAAGQGETAILAYTHGNTFRDEDRHLAYSVAHISDVDGEVNCYRLRRTADWVEKLVDS